MLMAYHCRRVRSVLFVLLIVAVLGGAPEIVLCGEVSITPEWLADYSQRYLQNVSKPTVTDTVFFAIAYEGSRYLTWETGNESVLLVFSSPFYLYNYARSSPDVLDPFRMVSWDAETGATRIRQIQSDSGVEQFALDPTYACEGFTAYVINEHLTANELIEFWYAARLASDAIGKKHYVRVREFIKEGDFDKAQELIYTLIGCAIPEEPRLHLLEGACGVYLGNNTLLERAINALQWLDPVLLEQMLEVLSRTGESGEDPSITAKSIVELLSGMGDGLLAQ